MRINLILVLLFTCLASNFISSLDISEKNYLKNLISKIEEKIEGVQKDRDTTTEVIRNLTAYGYETLVQNSEYQNIEGLSAEYYSDFLNDLLGSLQESISRENVTKLKSYLLRILKSKESDVRQFQIIYQDKISTKVVSLFIVVSYVKESQELNVIYTSTSTLQELQPNLLVIKTTKYERGVYSEEMSIVDEKKSKDSLPQKDIETIFHYFEVIALKKCSENIQTRKSFSMKSVYIEPLELNFLSDIGEEKEDDKKDDDFGFKDLIGGVDLITKTWKSVVDAFKTTKTITIKERIGGKGLDQIVATCMSDNIEGLDADMIDEYLSDFKKTIVFPSNPQLSEGLANSIKYTKYSKQKIFNGSNIVFTKENGGTATFLTFLHKKNSAQKTYDIIYSYYNADFKLSPDIWIMNKGLVVAGGIYENHEDYEKYVPRGITDEDMKAIMAFSTLINLKEIYAQLGFKSLELPSI